LGHKAVASPEGVEGYLQRRLSLVSVAVLAGGQSKRMGQDKAFLQVGQSSVIERVLDSVTGLTDDLFIGTNASKKYESFGLRVVTDVYPGKAALGGIYSAIHAARHSHVLVVACDMPFLNIELLRYLTDLASDVDVVAPLIEPPQPETMHAVYSKNCLGPIESRLLRNELRVIGFFDDVSVRYVKRDEVKKYDANLYSFFNINSPQDWQRAQALATKFP
jgi:molybdopterin-guanine dinucleotide biosynthesis protein A